VSTDPGRRAPHYFHGGLLADSGTLVELARGEVDDVGDAIAPWAAKQLSPGHVDWLAGLPYPVTLTVDGFGEVVFCHATPRDDQEVVVVDSRLERWADVLGDLPPEVMTVVCGHTHMPFTRLANTRQIINPGSVGMPYGRQDAHWAILSGGAGPMNARLLVWNVGTTSTPDTRPGRSRASRLQPSRADPPCSITTRRPGRSPRSCRSGPAPASSSAARGSRLIYQG